MSVIIPGSYDPITVGHLAIIEEVARCEDEVYVVAFVNDKKKYTFSLDDRVNMLQLATEHLDNVLVSFSLGRVVDYMREHEIDSFVKGYRNDSDLEWENFQAQYNKKHGGFDTRLIKCDGKYEHISSTLVRDRLTRGEDVTDLVPRSVLDYIKYINKG